MRRPDRVRLQSALRPLLIPLGAAYEHVVAARQRAFLNGHLARWVPPVPCVSVGNIAMGGTGKTPLTEWIIHQACARGATPAVLTRGYRATPPRVPFLVETHSSPEHAGDEPLLLARACPRAKVVVDPKRTRSGPWAWNRFRPGLFVLDDGFQHLAVARDLDLVLLRPQDLIDGWGRVFPAGYWREGPQALERASAFLVKADSATFDTLRPAIEQRLGRFGKPVFCFFPQPKGLTRIDGGEMVTPGEARRYILACGVADPAPVAATATALIGSEPIALQAFPDHHRFTSTDAAVLGRRARKLDAMVVVTAKDAVKLQPWADTLFLQLDMDLAFGPGLYTNLDFPAFFDAWWRQKLGGG